jgi:O-antigen ligase
MAMNLALMAPIALVLARKADWITMTAPLLGLVVVLLTRSRGTLVFFVLGGVLLYGLSLLRGGTNRKILVGVLGGALALAVIGRAAHRISERFETAPDSSMDTRGQFEKAASLMLRDHPLGIGANHFAWYLSTGGYGRQVGLEYGNVNAIVHNLYWLTAAELGPVGLLVLAVLLALPLVDAFRGAYRAPPLDVRGDLLIGLGVSLLACYLQSAFEWIWRSTDVAYVFWIDVGLVAALGAQVRRRASKRERRRHEKRRLRRQAATGDADEPEAKSPEPEAQTPTVEAESPAPADSPAPPVLEALDASPRRRRGRRRHARP